MTGSGYLLWPSASAAATALLTGLGINLPMAVALFAALTIVSTLVARRYLPSPFRPKGPDINDPSHRIVGHQGRVAPPPPPPQKILSPSLVLSERLRRQGAAGSPNRRQGMGGRAGRRPGAGRRRGCQGHRPLDRGAAEGDGGVIGRGPGEVSPQRPAQGREWSRSTESAAATR